MTEVRAEMVASVYEVVVAAGQSVEAGDVLLVLESMKMEIPVLSESAGRVVSLSVGKGAVVQEGDLLAVLA